MKGKRGLTKSSKRETFQCPCSEIFELIDYLEKQEWKGLSEYKPLLLHCKITQSGNTKKIMDHVWTIWRLHEEIQIENARIKEIKKSKKNKEKFKKEKEISEENKEKYRKEIKISGENKERYGKEIEILMQKMRERDYQLRLLLEY